MTSGDIVVLKFDDAPENQGIIGKRLRVERVVTETSPNWLDVSFEGRLYAVRGDSCLSVENPLAKRYLK